MDFKVISRISEVLATWSFDADLDFEITSLQPGPRLFSRVLFRGPTDALVFDLRGQLPWHCMKTPESKLVPVITCLDSVQANGMRFSELVRPFASNNHVSRFCLHLIGGEQGGDKHLGFMTRMCGVMWRTHVPRVAQPQSESERRIWTSDLGAEYLIGNGLFFSAVPSASSMYLYSPLRVLGFSKVRGSFWNVWLSPIYCYIGTNSRLRALMANWREDDAYG